VTAPSHRLFACPWPDCGVEVRFHEVQGDPRPTVEAAAALASKHLDAAHPGWTLAELRDRHEAAYRARRTP
jgi:hypothetical protein